MQSSSNQMYTQHAQLEKPLLKIGNSVASSSTIFIFFVIMFFPCQTCDSCFDKIGYLHFPSVLCLFSQNIRLFGLGSVTLETGWRGRARCGQIVTLRSTLFGGRGHLKVGGDISGRNYFRLANFPMNDENPPQKLR